MRALISFSTSFAQFSVDIPESSIPPVLGTVESPLQYGYRTKISPHFDAPPMKFQRAGPPILHMLQTIVGTEQMTQPEWLNIGFNPVGKKRAMDIEVRLHFCK